MPPDQPAAIAQALYLSAAQERRWDIGFAIGGSVDDEVAAYRNFPTSQPILTLVAVMDPDRGVPVLFQTRGQNFGLTSAVKSYNRKPAFQVTVARRFLACPVSPFFDDSTIVEPCFSRGSQGSGPRPPGQQFPGSSQAGLWFIAAETGTILSPRKSVPWEQVFTSVGIVNDFTTTHIDGTVATRVKPSSRDKLLALLKRAVVEDSMSPSDAASIASKLRWVTIGPVGRAATQPLRARQYDGGLTGDAGRFPISSSSPLMASVRFVIGLLETESIPDVVFRLRHSSRPKVTVWSDASWSPDPLLKFGSGRVAFIAKLV